MSRLVDLCRQCIVFETVADLVVCLQTIAADADARILRIKNRMNPAYNSAESWGYRDVALNLCVASARATELCVDGHVCELQLMLRSFAELKVGMLPFCNLRGVLTVDSVQIINPLAPQEAQWLKGEALAY